MAQQPQQSSGGNTDSSMAPVWVTIFVFLVVFIVWRSAHQYIVKFVFEINVLEAKFIFLFFSDKVLEQNVYLMQTIDPANVSWDEFVKLTTNVGDYMRYFVGAILLMLAVVLYQSNLSLKFRRAHNMKTLRAQEQTNWTAIAPIVKEDIINSDLSKGPWAMALSPMEFARKYKLLRKEDVLLDNPLPGSEMTAGIRRGDAKRVFTIQLGPYWDSFKRCPPHVQALAAVFAARINRDRASADKILIAINKSYALGKPDFMQALPVLDKYQHTVEIQEVISQHAYVLTMMASLIERARSDGVVPSAEFLWLKVIDRRMWYMLNSIGRQTPFSEVGGPFAHWRAEKKLGRRSLMPMIDEAIKALDVAVKEVKLTAKEFKELTL